jgi:GNAT superfamily N-acetyltransferase
MQLYGSDIALASRLEAAEAANGFAMAEATPGAEALAVLGGCAIFAGAGSPLTHTLGAGMDPAAATAAEFERMEQFYFDWSSDSLIDLCPMADPAVIEEITRRGYQVIEFNNVMARPLLTYDARYQAPPALEVRAIEPSESPLWCHTVARGFTGLDSPPEEMTSMMSTICDFAQAFLAAGGGAAMSVREGVALLYGDATVPEGRGKGVQSALIRARLAAAARAGAEFAMASVLPGSGSQRNYERAGFQLVYMRVNLRRAKP